MRTLKKKFEIFSRFMKYLHPKWSFILVELGLVAFATSTSADLLHQLGRQRGRELGRLA